MQNGARFGVNKRRFSGYGKQTPPMITFFNSIGGISPPIEGFFYNNYELSEISPSIYQQKP
jgi:hypothetical protein